MSGILDSLVAAAKDLWPAATKVGAVDGVTVTAGELETAAGSISGFIAAFGHAIATKNVGEGIELTLDEALQIVADMGLGQPITGILSALLPVIFDEINSNSGKWVIPQVTTDTENAIDARLGPQGDVPRMETTQNPTPAASASSYPDYHLPDPPAGMRPED